MPRWISRLSLRKKILLLAIGAELLLLGVASLLGLYVLSGNQAQLSQAMANSLVYSADSLTQAIDSASALTGVMLSDATIQNQLSRISDTLRPSERQVAYQALYNSIVNYRQQYRQYHISYIGLMNSSVSVHTSDTLSFRLPKDVADTVYAQAVANEGRVTIHTDWSETSGLLVSRAIRRVQPFDLKTSGVMILSLDLKRLVSDATAFNNVYDSTFYLLSKGDEVFYQSPALTEEDAQSVLNLSGDYGTVRLTRGIYFAQRGSIQKYGWGYTCLVSYGRQWQAQQNSYLLFLLILAATLILTVALSGAIVSSLTRRFGALLDKMKMFRGQELTHSPQEFGDERTDEVGLLDQQFDHMTSEIALLIQEQYVSELLAKDAQLQALQAQINPHFLYNVLDSINWRALSAGVPEISEIVDALGRFLRVSLNRDTKHLTLGEELQLVQYYVVIQKYRFEDQLLFTQQVPEELMGIQIPKMVIQPLVENSVKYAVETSVDGACDIRVEARAEGGQLLIDVKNSGSTMEDSLLERLRAGELHPHGFGIGLVNIDARMRLTYGENYGLQLYNENGYAVCRLRVPLSAAPGAEAAM